MVSAFERKGTAGLGELHGRPALVQCDRANRNETWGFETRAVTASWDVRVGIALARGGSVAAHELLAQAGPVYPITKRRGGPFPDRIGLGRARTVDIVLSHASVSKYHAYFTRDDTTPCWTLWDARSRNGTTVGERRLTPGESIALESGANVLFGEVMLLFFTEDGFRKLVENLAQSMPGAVR